MQYISARGRLLTMTEDSEGPPLRLAAHVFKPGNLVRHMYFGNGTVLESVLTEDDEEVRVQFDSEAGPIIKNLLVSFARLDAGWDTDDLYVQASPEARRLKKELFGEELTADDVAYILGLDRTTVLRYLRDGELTGYQIGREWRIERDEIRDYKGRLRREARKATRRIELQRRLEQLQREHVYNRWQLTVCENCLFPVLTSWHSAERNTGECGECRETVWLLVGSSAVDHAQGETPAPEQDEPPVPEHVEFDNMPF